MGQVAQLVRAFGLHPKGHRFKSCLAHHLYYRFSLKVDPMARWILYIVRCRDRSLYTGITTDIEKRIKCHNEGRASKYTRSRRPVRLVYKIDVGDESSARKEEARIKGLSRKEKLLLLK